MISKTLRMALMLVLGGFALSSVAGAANCSNASLSGTYGFMHDGTDSTGAPSSAAISQITFDPFTATFTVVTTASHAGVIVTQSFTGTYSIAPDCTGTGTPTGAMPFSIVVTPKGFLGLHTFSEGFAVKQDMRTCRNDSVKGAFDFETTGLYLAGAPATGWVSFIGELKLTVNSSGEGVISGNATGVEGSTTLQFAPVTGSFQVNSDCSVTATITANGQDQNFTLLIVDGGKKMLAVETDTNTVVSGTLVRDDGDDADVSVSASAMRKARPAGENGAGSGAVAAPVALRNATLKTLAANIWL